MSRTYMDISISAYTDAIDNQIRQILIAEHYREIPYNTEIVWKKGTGLMTAMHYIKLEYPNYHTVRLSGWVQIGVGSVGGRERDLSGFTGIIPKKSVQNTMNLIQNIVIQFDQNNPVTPPPPAPEENDAAIEKEMPSLTTAASVLKITPEATATKTVEPLSPVQQKQETGFVMVMQELPQPKDSADETTVSAATEPVQEDAVSENTVPNPFQRAERPCTEQQNEERKYFLWLSSANLAKELLKEQTECFAVDTRTEQPYYLIVRQGSLPSQCYYEIKEAVTWEELETYGNAEEKEALGFCNGSAWSDKICAITVDTDHITILWRKNQQSLEEASIFYKNNSFSLAHSERCRLNDPTAKGTRISLEPRHYRSETALQIALQSKISKAYIVQLLWDFIQETLQNQPSSESKSETLADEQPTQKSDEIPVERSSTTSAQSESTVQTTPPAKQEQPVPAPTSESPKKIIFCQNCGCKLKIPDKKIKLHVVCPKCKFDFYYKD